MCSQRSDFALRCPIKRILNFEFPVGNLHMVVGDKIRTGHSVLDRQRVKHRVSFKTSLLLNSPLRQISYVNQPENEADEDEASDSKKKKGVLKSSKKSRR